ncbi:Carcinoembryonic antigen-related cell adhesion molecule 21 [Myotis brandtii]|uniref:Carcinoembryonic antigen-related cell adhesion molecule 21 n=1 Tax=Myotis brandtii TaxID=109478 RepID=S7MK04_MYOBR|nr:Carcinoembryonic antigen-related cell adhesion molecule 21 [Myotis brandtii]
MNYYTLIASLTLHSRRSLRGPEYSGRETVNLDGTLTIRKVTVRDLGMYIVVAVLQNFQKEIGFGRLNVYRPVSVPTLLASNTTVTENEDTVVMTCYKDESSTN